MVKVILTDTEPQSISASYSFWRIVLTGLLLGLIYWGLTELTKDYVNSLVVAGNIATIIVATIGIIAMVNQRMAQPLIIAIATGVSLWGLAGLTRGLTWSEAVAWSIFLYMLAYVLFSWIARYIKPVPVLTAMIVVVIATRIAANL